MAEISTNELSDAALYALCYAQAVVYGEKSVQWKRFEAAQRKLSLSSADQRAALAKGLAELTDRGIIECERDGHGDLVPKVLHEERIVAANANLIARDLS